MQPKALRENVAQVFNLCWPEQVENLFHFPRLRAPAYPKLLAPRSNLPTSHASLLTFPV